MSYPRAPIRRRVAPARVHAPLFLPVVSFFAARSTAPTPTYCALTQAPLRRFGTAFFLGMTSSVTVPTARVTLHLTALLIWV